MRMAGTIGFLLIRARWLLPTTDHNAAPRREWNGMLEKMTEADARCKAEDMWALCSRRVVTPSGIRAAAVVIAGETIVDVIDVTK